MQVGNARYRTADDLPDIVPVFPLTAALLLPGGRMPLNIFEPRYLEMVDRALAHDRLIAMIQPRLDGALRSDGEPELCEVGCLGRLTSFAETGDGRYLISLQGVCRFRVAAEDAVRTPFRQCRITPFLADLDAEAGAEEVDRAALLQAFRAYLKANELEADWESVQRGMVVEARVTKSIKGGLEVDVDGMRGFLPVSQLELSYVADPDSYINQRFQVVVTEANPREKNLVVSRRD